jgi:cytochrome c oxidase cbb3-type subunit 1
MSSLAASDKTSDVAGTLRLPVLLFFGSAIFWLLVGTSLSTLAAWKLVLPGLLDGLPWLTYGRVQPAADNALIYGWASQAGLGIGLWILSRLGRVGLGYGTLLVTAAIFWNLGVLLGVGGIIAGVGGSFEGLEFPGFAAVVLLISYAFIGIWSLVLLRDRVSSGLFAAQWYLLAALLWFPWFYVTGNLFLVWCPVQGSAQGPIAWWFGNNLIWLWFTPICLAAAYYLVPVISRRPIHFYSSSSLAFWSLAFLGGWTGVRSLVGGPVPAWMVSSSVAASILMIIPVTIIGINLFKSLAGQPHTPVVGFLLFGLVCFVSMAVVNASSPLFSVVTHFSDVTLGQSTLAIYGFVSMVLFAAILFIFPSLLDTTLCPSCMAKHYWLTTLGVAGMVISLVLGGLIQGFALYDPGVIFIHSVEFAAPFRFLRAFGSLAFLLGSFAFAGLFVKTLLDKADVLPAPKKTGAVAV